MFGAQIRPEQRFPGTRSSCTCPPSPAQASLWLGRLYYIKGDLATAETHLARSVELRCSPASDLHDALVLRRCLDAVAAGQPDADGCRAVIGAVAARRGAAAAAAEAPADPDDCFPADEAALSEQLSRLGRLGSAASMDGPSATGVLQAGAAADFSYALDAAPAGGSSSSNAAAAGEGDTAPPPPRAAVEAFVGPLLESPLFRIDAEACGPEALALLLPLWQASREMPYGGVGGNAPAAPEAVERVRAALAEAGPAGDCAFVYYWHQARGLSWRRNLRKAHSFAVSVCFHDC